MSKHLIYAQRVQIELMYKHGVSRSDMAKEIGCSVRTMFYELKRGYYEKLDYKTYKTEKSYSADIAQNDYDLKQGNKARPIKLGKSWAFVEYIEQKIGVEKYSPRAALAEIAAQGLDFGFTVSHTTLYDWIEKGYLTVNYKHLPEGKRKHRKCNKNTRRVNYTIPKKSIEYRPKEVKERNTPFHWEMDTVIGQKKGRQKCLLVLTERLTGYEIIRVLNAKSAGETVRQLNIIERRNKGCFNDLFKTITVDNGCEFADYKGMEKNGRTQVYYCHPYSSWERGRNERTNRIIRRFVPKGQSMNVVTQKQADKIQNWLNNYPRKSLGWKTPKQLLDIELERCGLKLAI